MGSALAMKELSGQYLWWFKWTKEKLNKFLEPACFKVRPDPTLWKILQDSLIHTGLTHLAWWWITDIHLRWQEGVGRPHKLHFDSFLLLAWRCPWLAWRAFHFACWVRRCCFDLGLAIAIQPAYAGLPLWRWWKTALVCTLIWSCLRGLDL